jgi:hypothetical protein
MDKLTRDADATSANSRIANSIMWQAATSPTAISHPYFRPPHGQHERRAPRSQQHGDDGYGIHEVSRAPFVTVSWGPLRRYIVQSGVNVVRDRPNAQPGNFIEFPVTPETRISLRLFSGHWFRQEFRSWLSNHRAIEAWVLNQVTIARVARLCSTAREAKCRTLQLSCAGCPTGRSAQPDV